MAARSPRRVVSGGTALGEPERLRVTHRTDGLAEAFVDPPFGPERELAAATAGVEDDERAAVLVGTCTDALIGEPAFLVPGDDLDRDAGSTADRVETAVPLLAARRPAVPTATIARTPAAVASSTIAAIASASALGVRRDVAALGEAFAEAGDLGTVGQRRKPPGARSAMRNFTEFVPTSITANRSGRPSMMPAGPRVVMFR